MKLLRRRRRRRALQVEDVPDHAKRLALLRKLRDRPYELEHRLRVHRRQRAKRALDHDGICV